MKRNIFKKFKEFKTPDYQCTVGKEKKDKVKMEKLGKTKDLLVF